MTAGDLVQVDPRVAGDEACGSARPGRCRPPRRARSRLCRRVARRTASSGRPRRGPRPRAGPGSRRRRGPSRIASREVADRRQRHHPVAPGRSVGGQPEREVPTGGVPDDARRAGGDAEAVEQLRQAAYGELDVVARHRPAATATRPGGTPASRPRHRGPPARAPARGCAGGPTPASRTRRAGVRRAACPARSGGTRRGGAGRRLRPRDRRTGRSRRAGRAAWWPR